MGPESLAKCLISAARRGAEIAVTERRRSTISFKSPSRPSSRLVAFGAGIVTSADVAVQEAILRSLLEAGLENYRVIAEEDTPLVSCFRANRDAPRLFVDPIDGTLTYALECPDFDGSAAAAGFSEALIDVVRARTNSQYYGIVIGGVLPGPTVVAVCVLPEMGIVYHALEGSAFRNDEHLTVSGRLRQSRVAINRRLLDPSGDKSTPFTQAGLTVRAYNGSNPGILYQIFEGDCTAYAGLRCSFDAQLASVVARAAGLLVADCNGTNFVTELSDTVDGMIFASAATEKDRISGVMQRILLGAATPQE